MYAHLSETELEAIAFMESQRPTTGIADDDYDVELDEEGGE